jgi:hypothetical protein
MMSSLTASVSIVTITSAKTFFVGTEALCQSHQSHQDVCAYYVLYLGLSVSPASKLNLILALTLSSETITHPT